MASRHDNLIDGRWTPGQSYAPNVNPSNLADIIGDYAQGDANDVNTAVAAATAAFAAWSTSGSRCASIARRSSARWPA